MIPNKTNTVENFTLFNILKLERVIGKNKKQVKKCFGQQFNDFNSDLWIYRISNLTKKPISNKFLYLFFKNNVLTDVKFSKMNKILFIYNKFSLFISNLLT